MKFAVVAVLMACGMSAPSSASVWDSLARATIRAAERSAIESVRPSVEGLMSQNTPNTANIGAPICRRFVFSSTVIRVANFCQLREGSYLDIDFMNSTAYRYFDVPASTYDAFVAASSAGRFFHSGIRNRYRCERISQQPRIRNSQGCS